MKPPPFLAPLLTTTLVSLVSCGGPGIRDERTMQAHERALDWTVGKWTGVRIDAEDGSEGAMAMRVASILGGAGQTREIEIEHEGGVYRGFCVQVFDRERARWHRRYVNDVKRTYASLVGLVDGWRSVWRSVTPERTRETLLVSERPEPDRWVRRMSISEDGGTSWKEIWRDELRRVAE